MYFVFLVPQIIKNELWKWYVVDFIKSIAFFIFTKYNKYEKYNKILKEVY